MTSIRTRLLLGLLAAVALTGLLGALLLYRNALATADAVFDQQMRQIAASLRDQSFERALPPQPDPEAALEDLVIQVWSPLGVRVYFSRPVPRVPGLAQPGFSEAQVDGDAWRVYALPTRGYVIQVAQPTRTRRERAAGLALRTIIPFGLLLPFLAGLIWYIVGRALLPLERLAREVRSRPPASLQPLTTLRLAAEVRPLVDALNGLLERLSALLESQRGFVADAAHELRTPLTALRLQLQLAHEESASHSEPAAPGTAISAARDQAFAQLALGVERASRLVEQLLALARSEAPEGAGLEATAVNLEALAHEVVAAHASLAEARDIDLGITDSVPICIPGQHDALVTLLSNLVDNAVRYTPAGGRVDVSLRSDHGQALLSVTDTGPGIPPADRERVFDRFYRRSGTEPPGTGLGLAIVRSVAACHGAAIELADAAGGGLAVSVRFPVAAANS